MSQIIYLSQKRQERKANEQTVVAKKEQLNPQTIKLWRLSMDLDDLVKQGVLEEGLPADEVVTIIAHRLGTLISCCDKSAELSEFCFELMKKIVEDATLQVR